MNPERYPWTRYWCPREGQLRMDDDGFLLDPNSTWGRLVRVELKQLHEMANPGALLLLGEPGLGKSDAMTEAQQLLVCAPDSIVYAPRLQIVNSAQQVQAIFKGDKIQTWANGTGMLHLYLDALDECLLRVDVFGPLLIEELRSMPLNRMRLYLACRTAEWPLSFETELTKLLKKHGTELSAFELAPLRRCDVESAASLEGLDPAEVLTAIDQNGAAPLAMKPVTLRLLLRTFRTANVLSSQIELYRAGMRALVTESMHRRDTQLAGNLEPQERLVIAERIAALSIFTGRSILEQDIGQQVTSGVLPVWEISDGYETSNGRQIAVSESAVNEVLDTGLFSLRGARQLGWAHQTYAEYLAAMYLLNRNVTARQLAGLLQAADGRVIPQLHGVAAWVAAISPDLLHVVAASDPEILIATDIVLPSDSQREVLVAHLLRRTREGLRMNVLQARKLGKVMHPRLHVQLAPYLAGRKTEEERDLALDIAIFSKEERLLADVVAVALDTKAPFHLRQTAAIGVISFGSPSLRGRLKQLIYEQLDDPEERLNWLGMQAAWPDGLTPAELFDALRTRQPLSSLQAYSVFPVREIANGFTAETLPAAMQWAADREEQLGKRYQRQHAESLIDDFVDVLMLRAWEVLNDDDAIRESFTRIAWSRMRRWDSIVGSIYGSDFHEMLESDMSRRHKLAEALVEKCEDLSDVPRLLSTSQGVLTRGDVPWLGQRLHEAEGVLLKQAYAMAMVRFADPMQPAHAEAIFSVLDESADIAAAFGWIRETVALQSNRATTMRRAHAKAEAERRRDEQAKRRGPTVQQLRDVLANISTTELDSWWQFGRLLERSDENPDYGDARERDLTKLPGWSKLMSGDIEQVIAAADTYAHHGRPKSEDWLGQQVFHYGAAGGVRALALLASHAPDRLRTLPMSVWERWAIAIVGVSTNAPELAMLREGYAYAPAAILHAIDEVIRVEGQKDGDLQIARRLSTIWDSHVADRLFGHVKSGVVSASARATLLETLLEHRHEEARRYAEGSLSPLPTTGSAEWTAAVRTAVQLLSHVPDLSWLSVLRAMQDAAFADDVIRLAAQEDQFRGAMLIRFSEAQLGAFFEIVAFRFPSSSDPHHPQLKVFSPSVRDDIARWRNMLLTTLMNRGTSAALSAMRHAVETLPQEQYLPRAVREASAKWRELQWRPITTSQLLALASNRDARFVDNAVELARVVEESLSRFQGLLLGETPLVQFLWNEYRSGKVIRRRPKKETQLSDLLKIFLDLDLRQRGIIVNREVQIRPTITPGTGEVTDIHVDAAAFDGRRDRIATIVEVKGCWNEDLSTAMKTQLRERYLNDNGDVSGIYCVGWFQCDSWDSTDHRKRSTRHLGLDQVRKKLVAQALRLSGASRITAVVLDTRLPEARPDPSAKAPRLRRHKSRRIVRGSKKQRAVKNNANRR